ncbi:hypothetical protein [Bradyrhizobium sp. 21]|uniref:hypothetical protein n=1 Tax=Bradyrhizobium sp. 21 TaxID=2782666 RepID=UPI003211B096|nr:hypothetical protein [Bradyrhizobium sp. 21]
MRRRCRRLRHGAPGEDPRQWKAATEALLLVAERGGPAMLARIGMMRALNGEAPRTTMVKPPATLVRNP